METTMELRVSLSKARQPRGLASAPHAQLSDSNIESYGVIRPVRQPQSHVEIVSRTRTVKA